MTVDQVLLAGLSWDPFVRGVVIFLASVVILPGSVFLLLSTNTGGRLGFVLAVTGLAGWMTVMGIVWTVFGIGPKGREPSWKVQDVVTGEVSDSTVEAVQGFPRGWERLKKGDTELADAEAAAQPVLVPGGGGGEGGGEGGGGHGGGGDAAGGQEQQFSSPFKSAVEFDVVGARRKGGETYFLTLRHKPHYVVYQVKPKQEEAPAAPASTPQVGGSPGGGSGASTQPPPGQPPAAVTPAPPSQSPSGATPPPGEQPPGGVTTQPSAAAPTAQPAPTPQPPPEMTSVIMVRDLGNVRLPPALVTLAFLLVFAMCCYVLHERDKEIQQARGARVT